ncbi:MAG: hypothetical protein MUE95_08790 [Cyclobacteriaceae bacterium]|nr:hypothetical protein [Cyclobacteriaceae bacterium]
MTFFDKILGKSPKKVLKPRCPITREPIEQGYGYLLTTVQVVTSRKYWDLVMTEPETMSYTLSHFNNQPSGTQMRNLIFEKYSSIDKPWIISDSCISLFEIDRNQARTRAQQWWQSEGNYMPEEAGAALDKLEPSVYQQLKDYAVLEAGRHRVQAA